jgi:hypothetical protein
MVWVPGLALDRRVAVKLETRRVVHLRFEPNDQAPRVPGKGKSEVGPCH